MVVLLVPVSSTSVPPTPLPATPSSASVSSVSAIVSSFFPGFPPVVLSVCFFCPGFPVPTAADVRVPSFPGPRSTTFHRVTEPGFGSVEGWAGHCLLRS